MSDTLMIWLDQQGPEESSWTAFRNGPDDTFTISVDLQVISGLRSFEGMMVLGASQNPEWRSVLDRFLPAKYGKDIAEAVALARGDYDARFPLDADGGRTGNIRDMVLSVDRNIFPTCPDDIIVSAALV